VRPIRLRALAPLALFAAAGWPANGAGTVDSALLAQGSEADWAAHGRTYAEQRWSPLAQIDAGNVSALGLAWYADLDTNLTQEATPLAIDGRIYVSTAWSKAFAFDAVTGERLWQYDPQVPRETLAKTWDAFNRGMAAWGDKLYLATLDGRLIALDRATGRPVWSVTTVDQTKNYTISGAPRMANGLVVIGNAGADMGVRGYVTAYDAETGEQRWRFHTVPDRPGSNAEDYLRRAEATWNGDTWWQIGGGGTVWDSMAYDPELDLLYIGVGNGSLWNQALRSPGGGDNLYTSSIVAIRASTGEYVWHFQQVPGETWDYTATQHIVLADLTIDGRVRKVLMQAPKNGFFYVIDRETGQFISGRNYVPVNWATGLDPTTGRPIENPEARFDRTGKPVFVMPSAQGAHNWQPMAWDARQQVMFIPAQISAFPYVPDPAWKPAALGFNTGLDLGVLGAPGGPVPGPEVIEALNSGPPGALVAWDPVTQSERWRVRHAGGTNGGLLATAGGLLFQGSRAGTFSAYSTADGRELWSFAAQTGILAAPITFTAAGEQYVAVLAGVGASKPVAPGMPALPNVSRLLVFKLGGTARLPEAPPVRRFAVDPPAEVPDAARVAQGRRHYSNHCLFCHLPAGGPGPDLRFSAALRDAQAWKAIVHDGALAKSGMVGWSAVLDPDEVEAIRAYFIAEAQAFAAQPGALQPPPAQVH